MAKFIHVILMLLSQTHKFVASAKKVRDGLTGNPRFSTPSPWLAVLATRITVLEKATSGPVADRLAAEEQVREALGHLRDYVQDIAETQSGTVDLLAILALVESAGMELRKVGAHPKQVFAAKYGAVAGSVALTAPTSPKGDTHEWQGSADQQTWAGLLGTRKAKTRVTGLPVGVLHYFRHRFLTKDGPTEWSDPVMIMVK